MLERLRRREGQKGFTLIELLVVVIIIGLLAAIAIPAFLGQREKANDAAAKSLVRNGATAMEAYFADGNTYAGADATKLSAIEPNIAWVATGGLTKDNQVSYGTPTDNGYVLQSTSQSGTTWIYTKDLTKVPTVSRTCSPATACPATGW